ncbi:MAG: hypothetical protein CVU16_16300, partial [Betaproteobacteria bacterium HGW-Betaproteobacteria-10]
MAKYSPFNPPSKQLSMANITQLVQILQTVQRPGDFYATGRQEIFAPNITVDRVGPIALPLLPVQAEQLIAIAERAPYGRGEETLIDTDVRRTWQISPEHIQIGGRHWAENLQAIVGQCASGLGIQEPVVAELYKMLVYDTGSFFVGHRDTEKAPGMFATLVIVLPSIFTGGELLVRHQGREVCLDLSTQDAAEVAFAAFYADCWHEVRPVSSGCRLTLIYNLIRQGAGQLPRPPAYPAEIEHVTAMLGQWTRDLANSPSSLPKKLIYPLEHIYTPAEISFAGLKNADAAVAAVLQEAARQANCELHLALVSIRESGSAEATGYYPRGGYYDDAEPEDYEVCEICERDLSLSDWCTPDGTRPALVDLPFLETELCPPDCFVDAEPDEQEFFEATGNAGASFERSYRRAALVLWPQSGKLSVIAGAGLAVALPYLAAQVDRWQAAGTEPHSILWQEAHELVGQIIKGWPATIEWQRSLMPGNATKFLTSLCLLQDRASIVEFLSEIPAKGNYAAGDNAALSQASHLLPPGLAAELIERIVCHSVAQHAACAELLYQVALGLGEDALLLQAAAACLVAALPGDPAQAPAPSPENGWGRNRTVTPALIADLLSALHLIGNSQLGRLVVEQVLAWPQTFPLDVIVLPAALILRERLPMAQEQTQGQTQGQAPIQALNAACLRHLAQRIAEPLAAPGDFIRASRITCQCQDCQPLAVFLRDPQRKEWIFKAAE